MEANRIIDRIVGPYWIAAIAIFLIWSFGWNAWHQSWIVWPIAGVLFGLLATTVGAIKRVERG
ncbi:hypothetical protein ACFFFR_06975 [Micrococcoides hystricis]|uniref:DUF4175 domain-containing protein n=1 Tax=Micrococcoides hystricis TaxID=1572761 RepID=A0ABV6PBA3_9MICC